MNKLSLLTPNLQKDGDNPLYLQLFLFIKKEIETQKLLEDTRLPSIRNLAEYLCLSRNTVDLAYQLLIQEDFIRSVQGSGFFVNRVREHKEIPRESTTSLHNPPIRYDFYHKAVDYREFPYAIWNQIAKTNSLLSGSDDTHSMDPKGEGYLRKEIAKYLYSVRGLHCNPDQIVIGTSSTQLLQILLTLTNSKSHGDTVVYFEDPGYDVVRNFFIHQGYEIQPIRMEVDGLCVEDLKKHQLNGYLYTSPSQQVPLGSMMSLTKRKALMEWAEQNQVYVIEDDFDCAFTYEHSPIPALQSFDQNENVIYLGGFFRILCPEILCSYMVLPPHLLKKYNSTVATYSTPGISIHLQKQLFTFISEGNLYKHTKKMKIIYKQKNKRIIEIIEQNFGPTVNVIDTGAGTHLVLELVTKGINEEDELAQLAISSGVYLISTKKYRYLYTPENPQFILNYGGLQIEELEEAIVHLKIAWSIE
ncbi:PLP-dependent aminotransferase family protein [Bacillus sp. FJAT-49736]|uniref:MocR-like pyridoxine biosynthesis transcription factor PdxR n=1 Tax=Bacillus sp. FJAT-49736 TaxID=2833582 RepID=UPI001BC94C24|nr:PLP-dependent aminotransferase family protein [Bacillus sp. FJAT-49736]MBS4174753.1 PLP-dependent aminotransferase family protein [Bacillus sp. FJAT-49736]